MAWPLIALLAMAPLSRSAAPVVSPVETPGVCGVTGHFTVAVSRAVAWRVLTDYERIPSYVTSMRSSRLESGDHGQRLLRQEAVARLFLFKKRMSVLLELAEEPRRTIRFHDVLGRDFVDYDGVWTLSDVDGAVRVEYKLAVTPRSAIARKLCKSQLRATALELLEQVQAEMVRRARE